MKTLLILLVQNSIEQSAEDQSIRSLIIILSVFSITVLLLLVLNLLKVYKQKKRIKFLEDQLNS